MTAILGAGATGLAGYAARAKGSKERHDEEWQAGYDHAKNELKAQHDAAIATMLMQPAIAKITGVST